MRVGRILIVLAVIALVAALPTWGYSQSWGYSPVGIIGLVFLILLVLALLQKIWGAPQFVQRRTRSRPTCRHWRLEARPKGACRRVIARLVRDLRAMAGAETQPHRQHN